MNLLDKLNKLAGKINQELLANPLVQEYQALERAYSSNVYLHDLEKKIVAIQKEIVIVKSKKGSTQDLIREYNRIKSEFASHPLTVNYQNSREELNELLQEINKYINNQLILDKVTDIS